MSQLPPKTGRPIVVRAQNVPDQRLLLRVLTSQMQLYCCPIYDAQYATVKSLERWFDGMLCDHFFSISTRDELGLFFSLLRDFEKSQTTFNVATALLRRTSLAGWAQVRMQMLHNEVDEIAKSSPNAWVYGS